MFSEKVQVLKNSENLSFSFFPWVLRVFFATNPWIYFERKYKRMKFVEKFYVIERVENENVLLIERVLTVVKHHNILLCFAGNWVADWSRSPFSSAVPLTHSHNNPQDYTPLCCSTNVVVLHSVEKKYNWPLNASFFTHCSKRDWYPIFAPFWCRAAAKQNLKSCILTFTSSRPST